MVDFCREKPLAVDEVAEIFRVHPRTVGNWFRRGLEKRRLGGRVYTSLEAIQRFSTDDEPDPPDLSGDINLANAQTEATATRTQAAIARMQARWGKSSRV